ncbi:MAG TPA: metal-transporting ATPase, partial [Ignavibacteria bacterium]|nr:metal-transporting ATPase [Ignavibacteria bacterium]
MVEMTKENYKSKSIEEVITELNSNKEGGLSEEEVKERLKKYGLNEISEKKVSPLMRFLSYFWGPIPWMIEIASILSLIVKRWTDLIIILVLLFFNAIVGFWQEHKASDAVAALKKQLALKARAKRNGKWIEIKAVQLVPGDIIRLRLGDIIPADVKLIEGEYLSVDQSALTGESLPVDKNSGDVAYSGTIVKQGEMDAIVTSIGANTYFGQTAKLVSEAKSISHFQKAVLHIGDYLIYLSLGLAIILIFVELYRGEPVLS